MPLTVLQAARVKARPIRRIEKEGFMVCRRGSCGVGSGEPADVHEVAGGGGGCSHGGGPPGGGAAPAPAAFAGGGVGGGAAPARVEREDVRGGKRVDVGGGR